MGRTSSEAGRAYCYSPFAIRSPLAALPRGELQHGSGEERRSGRAELDELDRVEVLHAAADALGRVEEHVGLLAVGVAEHAHAEPIDDQIAAGEIAERDRERVRADIRHVLGL